MTEEKTIAEGIKEYLAKSGIAPLLEEFVTECVLERPENILGYLEEFAKRKQLVANESKEQWTLKRCWTEYPGKTPAQQKAFGESFFHMLFLQHRVLRRTVFEKVADSLPTELFATLFGQCVTGELTPIQMAALAAAHLTDVPIESYHYQAMITTTLLALRQAMPAEVWEATMGEWRTFCTDLGLLAESIINDAKSASLVATPSAALEDEDEKKVSMAMPESWDILPHAEQSRIARGALEVLFLQHAPLKGAFFAGVDLEKLAAALNPLVAKIASDKLADEDIISTGIVAAIQQNGAQPYHIQYGITALLMALSMAFGRDHWTSGVSAPWRLAITSVGDRIWRLVTESSAKAPVSNTQEEEL